jgi:hypothetical protein
MWSDIEKIDVSSGDRFLGASTAYGYQTTIWFWRFRLHIFWREDPGEAFHDHPWDYATFPLHPYVEDVLDLVTGKVTRQVVPAFTVTRRNAEHAHRIIGRWDGIDRFFQEEPEAGEPRAEPQTVSGAVVTLVRRGPIRREWAYFNVKGAKVHRLPWRRYLALADQYPKQSTGAPI